MKVVQDAILPFFDEKDEKGHPKETRRARVVTVQHSGGSKTDRFELAVDSGQPELDALLATLSD